MINLEGVCKWFDEGKSKKQIQALSDVTLHIPKGEIIGLIGRSGAGKTTFLKLLCGLLAPNCGSVKVMGLEPVSDRKTLSLRVSTLFANTSALNRNEKVSCNLEILKSIYRVSSNIFDYELSRLSDMFDITESMDERVENLSLGQRRRVELVSTFLSQADLILMDEPCIGLDAFAKHMFQTMVKELQERGKTILLSSHNMCEIDEICTRIILLEEGKIKFYGNKRELYRLFAPIDVMTVKCHEKLPNMQDLPFVSYTMDDLLLTISYNTNHLTASEIIRVLLQTTSIREVTIKKPSLEDVISAIERK